VSEDEPAAGTVYAFRAVAQLPDGGSITVYGHTIGHVEEVFAGMNLSGVQVTGNPDCEMVADKPGRDQLAMVITKPPSLD